MVFLVLLNSWETPVLLPKAMRSAESQVTNWAQKVDVIMATKTSFWGESSVWLPKQGLTVFFSPQIVLPKDVWCCFCPGNEICVFCANSLYRDPFVLLTGTAWSSPQVSSSPLKTQPRVAGAPLNKLVIPPGLEFLHLLVP